MKTFPMFLKMEHRHVVIIGGDEQAAQKCRLMLKTDALICVVADQLEPELDGYLRAGRITLHAPDQASALFKDAALIFIATGCKGADAAWHSIAKTIAAVVNVVDYPELCDAYTPSIVDRDPVVVAIGTEGAAPVLGRQIRAQIEQMLEPRLGEFTKFCGNMREAVAQRFQSSERLRLWKWVFNAPRQKFAQGSEREALKMVKHAVQTGELDQNSADLNVHEIVAEARAPDLISLRDFSRLQDADLILYTDPKLATVLEFARRDAARRQISDNPFELKDVLAEAQSGASTGGMNIVVLKERAQSPKVVEFSSSSCNLSA